MLQKKSLLAVAPLFLILFIDGMGLSLLFPIVNSIIIQQSSNFLPQTMALGEREFLYGIVIGIYMICWFFGAAIMGDLSDAAGRKRSLLLCLIGAIGGYLLSAIAVNTSSIGLLILGRIIAGFTAGSQPIAQAAIVDVSIPETKARNISFIILSVSLGFVIGPLIGGVLSDPKIMSWFDYSTPLYFAALLSLLNAVLLQTLFQETFNRVEKIKIKFSRAVTIFIEAFKNPKIRKLSFVMLLMMFGWANYYTFIPLYLYEQYHYGTLMTAYFMTTLGLGFGIGAGFLVDFCARHYDNRKNVIYGCAVTGVFVVLTIIVSNHLAAWFFSVVIGAAINVAYSIIISLFSDQVGENDQGWVMGVTGAIMALCFGVASSVAGLIAEDSAKLPLIVSALGLFLAAILLAAMKVSSTKTSVS